jgi:hypothetical protein
MKANWILKGKGESRHWLDTNTGERISYNLYANPHLESSLWLIKGSKENRALKAKKPCKSADLMLAAMLQA